MSDPAKPYPVLGLVSEYRRAWAVFSRNARHFLLGSFLLGIGANQISLLWSLYLKSSGYSPDLIGQTLSVRALGSTILALPASLVIAKFDARRFLPATAILVTAAYVCQSLVADGNAIFASVFLAGAFSTVFQVSAGPFFMKNSGIEERVHLFSLNSALSMGTGLLGSLFGGFLKDGLLGLGVVEAWSYRIALLAGATFVLASALPFSRIEAEAKQHAPEALAPEKAMGGKCLAGEQAFDHRSRISPLLWLKLILPNCLVGLGAGLTVPYLNLYFKLDFNLGDAAIGAAVAAGQVATFVGMVGSPVLARRLGKEKTVVITQSLSIPLILVLAFVKSLPLALLAYLARQVLMNMSSPIQDNFVLELVPPAKQGLVNAIKMLAWTGTWTIAARISGSFINSGSFATSFVLTSAAYALSTLLFWLFFLHGKPLPRKA